MYHNFGFVVLSALTLMFLHACKKAAPVPTYITIDGMDLYNDQNEKLSSRITTAYVSYGNATEVASVGVFRLPCTIPVVTDVDGDLYIRAGVDNDGSVSQSYYFPFYQRIDLKIPHKPGDTIDYGTLSTSYTSDVDPRFTEDFENGNNFVIEGADSAASLQIEHQIVSSGATAIQLQLSPPQKIAYYVNVLPIPILRNQSTYLQFDYTSDVDFGVVLFYRNLNTQNYEEYNLLAVRKKDNWNTIYLNLRDEANNWGNTNMRVGFKMARNEGDPTGTVYIDNVQVISEK